MGNTGAYFPDDGPYVECSECGAMMYAGYWDWDVEPEPLCEECLEAARNDEDEDHEA